MLAKRLQLRAKSRMHEMVAAPIDADAPAARERFRAEFAPTPHLLFAIWEENRQPGARGFLCPWAVSLTAFSDVLENYGGGPSRVGIRGRAGTNLLDPFGSDRSHRFIRIGRIDIAWLTHRLTLGTPVENR